MSAPTFLALEDVLRIHEDQILRYGGTSGVRDLTLAESAIAMPLAGFGGQLLHPTLFEQAAAYLFHLVQNHPFLDGNKRTGAAVSLAFLYLNGYEVVADTKTLVDLVLGVAQGQTAKSDVAVFLRDRAVPID